MHLDRRKDWIMAWRVTETNPSSPSVTGGKWRKIRTFLGRSSRVSCTVIFSGRDSGESFTPTSSHQPK